MSPLCRSLPALILFGAAACSNESGPDPFPSATAERALSAYKQVVHTNYEEVLAQARKLEAAIVAFVATPSADTLAAAKQAWVAARKPYGPSEAFRFYDGPIDAPEGGPEGLINGWPLDENYIDYTRDEPSAGIINNLTLYPAITAEVIANANEAAGEKALSIGYHAIEFLLWGQDDQLPGQGAGKRAYTDYIAGGAASNAERRGTYLKLTAQLLVQHLEQVAAAWRPGADNFAAHFGVDAEEPGEDARKEAIGKILRALGSLAKAELSGERMTVAYANRTQEDEHSCFSDTTAVDLLGNGLGLQNVWLGRYGALDGTGIDDVVRERDPALVAQTTAELDTAVAKLQGLVALQESGTPIDVVLQSADGSPGRTTMLEAIQALKRVGDGIERAAVALGLSIQLEQPSQTL